MSALLLLALGGCPVHKDTPMQTCNPSLTLADEDNYAFSGVIDAPSYTTVSGADVEICWDAVTTDLQCHTLDPLADVANVGLVRFGTLTEAEVELGLAQDELQQADMTGYVEIRPDGDSCVNLADMSFFGTPFDVTTEYMDDGSTYLLLLSESTDPGIGARMLAFLDPTEGDTNTRVDLDPGCGMLTFEVDFEALTPAMPCATGASWPVDWADVETDGQGNDIGDGDIDGVLLGFYEGWTVADLEANILDLELSATKLYTLPVTSGTSADLADATDASGAAFTGFSGDGEWVLALTCSRCYNPAPPFVTRVTPVAN